MTLAEILTSGTDFLLALQSAFYALLLARQIGFGRFSATHFWPGLFVFSSAAALAGGSLHAMKASQIAVPDLLWRFVLVFVMGASFCLLAAACASWMARRRRVLGWAVILVKTLLVAGMVSFSASFRWVVLDYAVSFAAVLLAVLTRLKESGSRALAAGILVSFAAAYVQQAGIGLSEAVNHNVLYHLIQMGGFYFLYQGARALVTKVRTA